MLNQCLTIKELTDLVGGNVTPRMVRHYHTLGLLPPPSRSSGNYRLYTQQDVQQLRWIVALKKQGFQLSHIQQLLKNDPTQKVSATLLTQLQQQYQTVVQQLAKLRQTASALESVLGRDQQCQIIQAQANAQLKLLEVETQDGAVALEKLWQNLDTQIDAHPEGFEESLQRLLPDMSHRSEIEIDLLSQLVLACGDVSLIHFVRLSQQAIAAARDALTVGCQVVCDVPAVSAALDLTRLAHLNCSIATLIADSHVSSATEAEEAFWQQHRKLEQVQSGCIIAIGYAPSVLMTTCSLIEQGLIQPALVIGMPIGFSHAPAAKRRLTRTDVPYLTIEGTLGGGLLAAVALNTFVGSLLEKPDCHCYLTPRSNLSECGQAQATEVFDLLHPID